MTGLNQIRLVINLVGCFVLSIEYRNNRMGKWRVSI